jgi:osmotically-inducible protein OsmY
MTMQRLKQRALGMLLAGLLTAGGARAEEADDVALTVAVRTALSHDARLAPLGLGATVSAGNVTVWGPVPSPDLAAIIETRVKALAGVKSVRTDFHIQPKGVADTGRKPAPRIAFPEPIVLSPLPGLSLSLVRADPEDEQSPSQPPITKPEDWRRTVAKEPPVEILAPEAPPRANPPVPPAPRPDLTAQIEAILDRSAKYDGVNVVIQSGLIRLNGTLTSWTHLWPLSDELSKLPGVKRVVVDKIAIAK